VTSLDRFTGSLTPNPRHQKPDDDSPVVNVVEPAKGAATCLGRLADRLGKPRQDAVAAVHMSLVS
jgi:hypothetical protein